MLRIIEWKRCNFVRMGEQEAITKHIHLLFIYTLQLLLLYMLVRKRKAEAEKKFFPFATKYYSIHRFLTRGARHIKLRRL